MMPREILDIILWFFLLRSSPKTLAHHSCLKKKWGWRAEKLLYFVVDLVSMDQVVQFLTTLTTIRAGSAFEIPEADVKLFLLTHHLRLLFKIIPSESAQLMKAHWWNIYPEMLFLQTFTFLFSECDSYAFEILTDGLRLLPALLIRMISTECDMSMVR